MQTHKERKICPVDSESWPAYSFCGKLSVGLMLGCCLLTQFKFVLSIILEYRSPSETSEFTISTPPFTSVYLTD